MFQSVEIELNIATQGQKHILTLQRDKGYVAFQCTQLHRYAHMQAHGNECDLGIECVCGLRYLHSLSRNKETKQFLFLVIDGACPL